MSAVSPEAFVTLLAKALKYFTSTDEVYLTEEEQWLERIASLNYNGLNPFAAYSEGKSLPVHRMLNLLRECLLTQRWEEVLKLITFLSEHRKTNYILFKVGLELCHHLEPCRGRYLEQVILHLLGPTTLFPRQVTLEYVLFLLSVNLDSPDIEGAATVFQTFKKPSLSKKHESEQMSKVFEAYKGLVWYTLWLQSKHKVEQIKSQLEVDFTDEVELSHEENKMKILCERALISLQMIRDQPGIWDIFITKYTELLEWNGDIDEIEPVLKEYQKNNPNYPNAHRYLLNYYKKQQRTNKILQLLQSLCALLPSDSAVLELVACHKCNNASPDITMPLLFGLLDYPCWKNSPEPWNLLADDLMCSLESETDAIIGECFQSCWSSRFSWWPKYHFHKQSLTNVTLTPDVCKLIASKAVVAVIFGVAAEFVGEARRLLSSEKQWKIFLDRASGAAKYLTVDMCATEREGVTLE